MDMSMVRSPTGTEIAPYLIGMLVLALPFLAAGRWLELRNPGRVGELFARLVFFSPLAFIALIGVGLLLPHNHGHIGWVAGASSKINHGLEVLTGSLLLLAVGCTYQKIWKPLEQLRRQR